MSRTWRSLVCVQLDDEPYAGRILETQDGKMSWRLFVVDQVEGLTKVAEGEVDSETDARLALSGAIHAHKNPTT